MTEQTESPDRSRWAIALLLGLFIPGVHLMWRPRIVGRENMPKKGPCFVYGNHAMYLDPFVLNIFLGMDITAGIMAREFLRKGVKAYFMRKIGMLPVSRNDASVVRAILKLVARGRKVMIYPEGGRRWAGKPLPWIMSTIKLYRRAGIPIHPVITHGSYVAWPRWARYPRPARLKLEFLPPVTLPKDISDEEAYRILNDPVDFDENVVPDDIKPKWAYRPADGIDILLYRDPDTGRSGEIYTPDGTHVCNRTGSLRYRMLPDSRLEDVESGDIVTTGALYDRIRALPRPIEPDGSIVTNRVDVQFAAEFPEFHSWGTAQASLFDDVLRVSGLPDGEKTFELGTAHHAQIERNWKFQLTFPHGILQLGFRHGGSALQWLDTVSDLGVKRL